MNLGANHIGPRAKPAGNFSVVRNLGRGETELGSKLSIGIILDCCSELVFKIQGQNDRVRLACITRQLWNDATVGHQSGGLEQKRLAIVPERSHGALTYLRAACLRRVPPN